MDRRIFCLALFFLTACNWQRPPDNSTLDTGNTGVPVSLTVMTFNIEWGGKHISFENVVEAIRRSGADIVGVQEAEGNLQELAAALEWSFDERNYVISRFELVDPPVADGKYVLVEVRPGEVIAVSNVHLPSEQYGPDLLRAGASATEVIGTERQVRMPMLNSYLERLADIVGAGVPIFVTGDFNSLAHTDGGAGVAWPVSIAMEKAGFRDSWRAVYPDAVKHPGFTWWAARPPLEAYAPGEDDPQGRIDMIWSAGPAFAQTTALIGERDGRGVTVSVEPWPSDHRGVVTTFDVEPVRLPDLLSTDRRVYSEGERPEFVYSFTGGDAGQVTVTDIDTDQVMETFPIRLPRGRIAISPLTPGRYIAEVTHSSRSYVRKFWVLAEGIQPRIDVLRREFAADEPVLIHWEGAPGYRNDYIAVYAADSAEEDREMLGYAYVNALPEGELDLRKGVAASGGVLQPGSYIAKLMKDDGYEVLAETRQFEIR